MIAATENSPGSDVSELPIRVLLIEDSELDYMVTKRLLSAAEDQSYQVEWAASYEDGLAAAGRLEHDVCLVDYHLGSQDGLDLVRKALENGCKAPLVLLTAQGDRRVDLEALEAGATDYLDKSEINSRLLERTIRYALEQSRAKEVLRESEKRAQQQLVELNRLYQTAPVGLALLDRELRVVRVNERLAAMSGQSVSDPVGRSIWEVVAPDVARVLETPLRQVVDRGEPVFDVEVKTTETEDPNRDLCRLVSCYPVKSEDGIVKGAGVVVQDVSEIKRAEQRLEHANAELANLRQHEQRLLTSIPSICIGLNEKGEVTHWNPVAEKTFGPKVSQVLGKRFLSLDIQWSWERMHDAIRRSSKVSGPVQLDEVRLVDAQGRDRLLELRVNGIQGASDRTAGVVVTGADITERKYMESQLVLAQKMESLGQLAAGIAHEINTPTQYVGDNVRFLRDAFHGLHSVLMCYEKLSAAVKRGDVRPDALAELETTLEKADLEYLTREIPRAVEESLEGVERVSTIVRAMKAFSHPDHDEKEPTDLNQAIESTVTVSRNEWKYVAEMKLDLAPDLPPVPCLLGGINQVLLNLIVNAAHAIADVVGDGSRGKGIIRITTRQVDGFVEIRVCDTGTGVPETIRDKIFNPFFTTKQVGKGSGQGLALAHNIVVEKHKGSIELESETGKGASFLVRLPRESPSKFPGLT